VSQNYGVLSRRKIREAPHLRAPTYIIWVTEIQPNLSFVPGNAG